MTTFSVPKEVRDLEYRVGLTPAGALALTRRDATVYVQAGAGARAGFADADYSANGAQIVHTAEEAYGRADVVLKVARPTQGEHKLFRPGQTLFSFLHLSVSSPDLSIALHDRKMTAVAYELIEEDDGERPVLFPMSEIAGRLAPIIAGRLLQTTEGGLGALLGGIPGVSPAAVVIVGAGVLGANAARVFLGLGAQVTLLDNSVRRLQRIDELFGGRINTMISNKFNLRRATQFADVLLGAVLIPGHRAPTLITEEMVKKMRPGSVVIDFSIDQGGIVETSRPTTLRDPCFSVHGVTHYCVPNATAAVSRTASYALTNSALPYLKAVARNDIGHAIGKISPLRRGVNVLDGEVVDSLSGNDSEWTDTAQ